MHMCKHLICHFFYLTCCNVISFPSILEPHDLLLFFGSLIFESCNYLLYLAMPGLWFSQFLLSINSSIVRLSSLFMLQKKKQDFLHKSIQTRPRAHDVIQKMLASLGDPYTRFLSPSEVISFLPIVDLA